MYDSVWEQALPASRQEGLRWRCGGSGAALETRQLELTHLISPWCMRQDQHSSQTTPLLENMCEHVRAVGAQTDIIR